MKETQTLPLSLEDAWAFFSDPHNLEKITPPDMNLVATNDVPAAAYPGMIVTYRIRLFPLVRLLWVTEITHVVDRQVFVDEQRFGPYRFWHHQHHFRAVQGGVEMTDLVHYALPFDPFSRWALAMIVHPQLRKIFAYRRLALSKFWP